MNFSRHSHRPQKLNKQSFSSSGLFSAKYSKQLKSFNKASDIPIEEISDYGYSIRPKEFIEDMLINEESGSKNSQLKFEIFNLKNKPDREYLNCHKEKKSYQEKSSSIDRIAIDRPHASHFSEFNQGRKSDSICDGNLIDILIHENKKLKSSLNVAEGDIKRLYGEIEIMADQLMIYQKRYQNYPENSASPSKMPDKKQYKDAVNSIQNNFEINFQNLIK